MGLLTKLLSRRLGLTARRGVEVLRRDDVLCFTTAALDRGLDVVGVPAVELEVASSAPSADFFVRVCDVDEAGGSRNVCGGLATSEPASRWRPAPRWLRPTRWSTSVAPIPPR